jgi:hypothetical protein
MASGLAQKTRAQQPIPIEERLRKGLVSFGIPNARIADFHTVIKEAVAFAPSRASGRSDAQVPASDNRQTVRELKKVRSAITNLFNVVSSVSQPARDALDSRSPVVEDVNVREFLEVVRYLSAVSEMAIHANKKQKGMRGPKKNPAVGDPRSRPSEEFVTDVLVGIWNCGGKWSVDKSNDSNSIMPFLHSLSEYLPCGFLRGLTVHRVSEISSEIKPTLTVSKN